MVTGGYFGYHRKDIKMDEMTEFERFIKRYEIFAKRLKTKREEKHLTIAELADLSALTPASLRQYEACACLPTSVNLCLLCDVLETTPDYLLGYVREPF